MCHRNYCHDQLAAADTMAAVQSGCLRLRTAVYSPSAAKLATVLGTVSPNSPITMRPAAQHRHKHSSTPKMF